MDSLQWPQAQTKPSQSRQLSICFACEVENQCQHPRQPQTGDAENRCNESMNQFVHNSHSVRVLSFSLIPLSVFNTGTGKEFLPNHKCPPALLISDRSEE